MSLRNNARQLEENLAAVTERVAAACARAGRSAADVSLVAVTKYTPLPLVRDLLSLGHRDLGENRPQQLITRATELNADPAFAQSPIQWHLIGQLQRNKVRAVLPYTHLIHSVDSLRLLERIDQIAAELSLRPQVLLQANVSGEASKSGFEPGELREQWSQIVACEHVDLAGMMTMAPETEDADLISGVFAGLRTLREELAAELKPDQRAGFRELSMGMSGDFEIAVEEGATLIRLGSVLFQGCDEPNSP